MRWHRKNNLNRHCVSVAMTPSRRPVFFKSISSSQSAAFRGKLCAWETKTHQNAKRKNRKSQKPDRRDAKQFAARIAETNPLTMRAANCSLPLTQLKRPYGLGRSTFAPRKGWGLGLYRGGAALQARRGASPISFGPSFSDGRRVDYSSKATKSRLPILVSRQETPPILSARQLRSNSRSSKLV